MGQLFKSFFLGGFECSTHRRRNGRRLDLIRSTRHDTYAEQDYLSLRAHGIEAVRDGLRWHLIENSPHHYDWTSFLPMLRAARQAKVQIVWDLCHYGWPDDLDIWSPEFIERFAGFAAAVASLVRDVSDETSFFAPSTRSRFGPGRAVTRGCSIQMPRAAAWS
jgi:hypothetical protein